MPKNPSHKGVPLRRKDDDGFAVVDDVPDEIFRTNPETGQLEQRGFDGAYHPLSWFARPTSFERVRAALHVAKPYARATGLRPLEAWKLTRDVLMDSER